MCIEELSLGTREYVSECSDTRVSNIRKKTGVLFGFIMTMALSSPSMAAEEQRSPLLFYHEQYGIPQFDSLKAEFDFDGYVAAGKNEFEQQCLLKDWVFRTINFDKSHDDGLRNALKILRLNKQGKGFYCTNNSAVFMQCALSLGWTSRLVGVRKPPEYSRVPGHSIADIWSNFHKKWFVVDLNFNLHFEKDGRPLAVYEVRDELIKNGCADIELVFGAGKSAVRYTVKDFPIKRTDNNACRWWPIDKEYLSYFYAPSIHGRNNFFTYKGGEGREIWDDPIYIIMDAHNREDPTWNLKKRTDIDDMNILFHDLNRVYIKTGPVKDGTVEITLDAFGKNNYTPNFKEYLVRINKGKWEAKEKKFSIKLKKGKNTICAKIRNKFGTEGPVIETVITL